MKRRSGAFVSMINRNENAPKSQQVIEKLQIQERDECVGELAMNYILNRDTVSVSYVQTGAYIKPTFPMSLLAISEIINVAPKRKYRIVTCNVINGLFDYIFDADVVFERVGSIDEDIAKAFVYAVFGGSRQTLCYILNCSNKKAIEILSLAMQLSKRIPPMFVGEGIPKAKIANTRFAIVETFARTARAFGVKDSAVLWDGERILALKSHLPEIVEQANKVIGFEGLVIE